MLYATDSEYPMTHSYQCLLCRREFLRYAAVTAGAFLAKQPLFAGSAESTSPKHRPKVAAVFTEFRFRSHAYNILENFFEPYLFAGKLVDPGVDVVSFYADQFPRNDMAREVSRRLKVPLFGSIDEALCVGGKKLAVDAVLSIGEHGDYPVNQRGQRMYPRKEFFDRIVAVMKRSGRFVPVFNDKHLSYHWDWAKEMYETAREHRFPLMAGSSVPLAQRIPPLELPAGAEFEEAVSIHGGGLESYDFHALEVLQSFVEARKGGETGISRIELLTGDALAQAARQGRWSKELVDAAMSAESRIGVQRQAQPSAGSVFRKRASASKPAVSHALLVTYKDGLRATVLKIGSTSNRWNFACRVRGESKPQATALFNGPWGNRCLFKALSHAIQYLFIHRKEPYPIERTLLVTGALDAAMQSHEQGGKPVNTPYLEFAYQPIDFRKLRETGASWKIITPKSPQSTRFEPGDGRFIRR